MKVEKREASDEEKLMLHDLLTSEFKGEKFIDEKKPNELGAERAFAYVATVNTVLNKIASPYTTKSGDIEEVLNNAKINGFLKYASGINERADIEELIAISVNNALSGVDYTKEYTLIGSTGYYGGVEAITSRESEKEEKDSKNSQNNQEEDKTEQEASKATGKTEYKELYYSRL